MEHGAQRGRLADHGVAAQAHSARRSSPTYRLEYRKQRAKLSRGSIWQTRADPDLAKAMFDYLVLLAVDPHSRGVASQ
jgi:hypothetical protein